jgi:peptide/nickel transport system substrate-binding protein
MTLLRRCVAALLLLLLPAGTTWPDTAKPEGQMTWGLHFSLAPTWFDPAETSGIITPYVVLYALHDAMVKPLPGNPMAPSLAESWTQSPDGLTYEFVLRANAKFHNGEPVRAEDVKFSLERYRGASAKMLKDRVAAIETPDAQRVRIVLKEPWPDFLTFYAIATGAGWIVPKAYVEKVGEDGFKRAPIGAGPYRFVAFTPGVELVLEAFESYWRKTPSVKRLVLRAIPDDATRLAALKRGEIDMGYAFWGALAEEVRRSPGLTLKATSVPTPFWLYFADQWDAKSPWRDHRVRRAANLAIDRNAINQAENLGFATITNSIVPASFDFYWQPPQYPYDPARAKALLAEAGYPSGFDAGDYNVDAAFVNVAEATVNYLRAVGIRAAIRPLERAAFFKGFGEKKLKNLIQGASGAFGNAATRIEAFIASSGAYAYGGYPDIDRLFRVQATQLDRQFRELSLITIQHLMHEKAMTAPIWQLAAMTGVGPRVKESGIGLVAGYAFFSAPYEDVTLKGK